MTLVSIGNVTDSSVGLCEMLFVKHSLSVFFCFLSSLLFSHPCLSYTTLSEPLDRRQEAVRSLRIQSSLHVPSVDNEL